MMFDKLNCQRCFKKWAGFLVVEMNFGQVNWVCLEGNQPSVVTHNHWDSPVSPELSCCCYHVRRRPLILLFWLLLTTFLPLFGKVLTDFLPSFVYFVSILRLFLMHFDYFWKLGYLWTLKICRFLIGIIVPTFFLLCGCILGYCCCC